MSIFTFIIIFFFGFLKFPSGLPWMSTALQRRTAHLVLQPFRSARAGAVSTTLADCLTSLPCRAKVAPHAWVSGTRDEWAAG